MLLSKRDCILLRYFYLSILCLLFCLRFSFGSDVFCGNLTVYRWKWSLENAMVLVSRTTNDLKQCLHICCSLADCQGVTFIGVIEKKMAQENCLLIKCHGECQFDNSILLSEGVSVKINRTKQNFTFADDIDAIDATTDADLLPYHFLSIVTPIWAIGLVIIVSVLCIGFNIVLISGYICWRRKKNQKRKARISTITALHAFNPT
uniref:Seven cysteines N-terminal domain-containing protein n=1 Tax=Onchocerca volvulus TaxID=6282 RepID=A0A8R1XN87_ONCVO